MENVVELMGACAATTVKTLVTQPPVEPPDAMGVFPSLLIERDGKRIITLFDHWTPEKAEEVAEMLALPYPPGTRAVLVTDGYATEDGRRSNAIILQGLSLTDPRRSIRMFVAYARPTVGKRWTVAYARLLDYDGFDPASVDLTAAFSRGRLEDAENAEVWDAHRG